MKLRNRKSYMTSLPEGSAPVSPRISITQLIYFTILISAVAYLIYIFGFRYFYFSEDGVVEIEKTVISSSRGGRLGQLSVREGQTIEIGDAIAVVEAARHCVRDADQRIEKLRYEIGVNEARKKLMAAEIARSKQGESSYTLYRALELDNGLRRDNRELQRQQQKLLSDARLLNDQINLQHERLKDLQERSANITMPAECSAENINALFVATVSAVHKRTKEFVGRGEAIVTLIRDNAPVRIELYMDNDQLRYVQQGDVLGLVFADGIEGEGRIKTIHSSAYRNPQREWNKYQPAEPQVLVYIEPLGAKDRMQWMSYDRMQVRVRGKR